MQTHHLPGGRNGLGSGAFGIGEVSLWEETPARTALRLKGCLTAKVRVLGIGGRVLAAQLPQVGRWGSGLGMVDRDFPGNP